MNKAQWYNVTQGLTCYEMKGYACVHCGLIATQLAHIVPQDKVMLKTYGYLVIHHWMNREPVCDLTCNAKSSIRNHPIAIAEKVEEIKRVIREGE